MAKLMIDIQLGEDEDLSILAGDFQVAESTAQHQQQLLLNTKGDFKESPTVCVGVFTYLNDERFQGLMRAINVEFSRDGMEVHEVSLSKQGDIVSDAVYK